ncbi:MAG: EAL domain-containing protein [Ruminococcus sp.]|nr:EAL domain-containing protein [Ruminococcus sp.]
MFAKSDLNIGSYTPVGDIIALSLCIIMAILVKQTYIRKEKSRFFIIMHILTFMLIAASANIFMQTYIVKKTVFPPFIYIMRMLHHVGLSMTMFLYIRYVQGSLWLMPKDKKRSRIAIAVIMLSAITLDIILSMFKVGFYINKKHEYNAGLDFFEILYIVFMVNIIYMLIKYRKRLLIKVFAGLISVLVMSNILLCIQSIFKQISYTTICCLLPIISIIFLFHSNPYNTDTGAVSGEFFTEEVKENLAKGNEMVIMCCHIPGFSGYIAKSPVLKTEFMDFFRVNIKKSILYSFPNDSFVLTFTKQKNSDYEKLVDRLLGNFAMSYAKFNIDYKIIIMESSDSVIDINDYHNIIEYNDQKMPFNTVVRVTPEDIKEYYDKNYILSQLEDIAARKDLSDPRILVYCQPVLNINTGQYDTAEALMRLKLEKTGMVFPDQFIPLAEQFNLIHNMSMIILNKTCAALKRFIEDGYIIKRISVNFSAIDLRYDSFCDEVKGIIESNGIEYGKIAVEITESRSEADFNLVKQRVIQLQDLGIKFYLDDFGTGYSNFERIMEIPFDIIKFDRSLLIESLKNSSSQYMVKTFANMFHELKYSILFEGVENEYDEDRCKLMMAQYLQGYKYSKPIPIEELKKFLLHA